MNSKFLVIFLEHYSDMEKQLARFYRVLPEHGDYLGGQWLVMAYLPSLPLLPDNTEKLSKPHNSEVHHKNSKWKIMGYCK